MMSIGPREVSVSPKVDMWWIEYDEVVPFADFRW